MLVLVYVSVLSMCQCMSVLSMCQWMLVYISVGLCVSVVYVSVGVSVGLVLVGVGGRCVCKFKWAQPLMYSGAVY